MAPFTNSQKNKKEMNEYLKIAVVALIIVIVYDKFLKDMLK